MSKATGIFLIVLGVALIMAGVPAMGYFFYVTARDHEQQPPRYRLFVNIGLLTVLPTILLFLCAVLPQIFANGYYADDLLIGFGAVIAVTFAVFRGNCGRMWRHVPPIAALYLFMTTGASMVELGRELNGKGYNYMGEATVIGFESIVEGELSLLTLEFTQKDYYNADNDETCVTAIELNCTEYIWREAFATDDDREYDWNKIYDYQRRNDAMDVSIYYKGGNSGFDDDKYSLSFTCEDGFDENADDEFPSAYEILGNMYSCDAAWYTRSVYSSSYFWETPTETIFIAGISATVLAVIFGMWKLCPDPNIKSDREIELLENESGVAT